jgi:DNA polymerase-3 subunit delta'
VLIGHKKQWQLLQKSVELGKISHAYLFFGQEKIGKKTLAFEFAKLINCQNPDFLKRPCQKCSSCEAIQKSLSQNIEQYPDLAILEPKNLVSKKTSQKKKEIKISQIRDLIWRLSLHSFSSPYKIAIIDKAHFMNQDAQSCFLKTLEEPRGDTVLILITEYPEILLSTIRSRVQKIKFNPVEKVEIENFLKSKGIPDEKAKNISSFSFGKPGLAIEFFNDLKNFEKQKQRTAELLKIVSKNSAISAKFNYVKDITSENSDLKEVLEMWLRFFRNVLILRIGKDAKKAKEDEYFGNYSISKLEAIINLIQNTIFLISKTNINQKLALEVLMLEL